MAGRHQPEMDVGHEAERALGADDQLSEVKHAGLAVPDIPEVIARGVFGHVRLGGFDLVVMRLDELEQLAGKLRLRNLFGPFS